MSDLRQAGSFHTMILESLRTLTLVAGIVLLGGGAGITLADALAGEPPRHAPERLALLASVGLLFAVLGLRLKRRDGWMLGGLVKGILLVALGIVGLRVLLRLA